MERRAKDRRAALEALEDPEDWLRALRGTHWSHGLRAAYHLRGVILRYEEWHVRRARELGIPWWMIAHELGITPQAAHGRWARFVGRPNASGKPRRFVHR